MAWPSRPTRAPMHDGEVGLLLHDGDQPGHLGRRGGEVGVVVARPRPRPRPSRPAARGARSRPCPRWSASDSSTNRSRVGVDEALQDGGRGVRRAVVDEHERGPGPLGQLRAAPSGSRRSASSKHGTTMATLTALLGRPFGLLGRSWPLPPQSVRRDRPRTVKAARSRRSFGGRSGHGPRGEAGDGAGRGGTSRRSAVASASRTAVSRGRDGRPGRPRADAGRRRGADRPAPRATLTARGPSSDGEHRAAVHHVEVSVEQRAEVRRPVPPVVLEHAVVVGEQRRVRGHADHRRPARRHRAAPPARPGTPRRPRCARGRRAASTRSNGPVRAPVRSARCAPRPGSRGPRSGS